MGEWASMSSGEGRSRGRDRLFPEWGAQYGAWSWDSRILTWATGRGLTEPPRYPWGCVFHLLGLLCSIQQWFRVRWGAWGRSRLFILILQMKKQKFKVTGFPHICPVVDPWHCSALLCVPPVRGSWWPLCPTEGRSQPRGSPSGLCTQHVALHIINAPPSLKWRNSLWLVLTEYDLSLSCIINIDNNRAYKCDPLVYLNRSSAHE